MKCKMLALRIGESCQAGHMSIDKVMQGWADKVGFQLAWLHSQVCSVCTAWSG